jgi:hypothetical protein
VGEFVNIVIAIVIFLVVVRLGLAAIRMIASPVPPPPPKGELRKVNAKFRCSVCGMEMKVVLSPDEEPEPPRHCMEEMEVVRALD